MHSQPVIVSCIRQGRGPLGKDCLGKDEMQKLRSADARACIAVSRPIGQLYAHRHLHKNSTMPTMPHQTGDLSLDALTVQQDLARGMFSACVTSDTFRDTVFKLREEEKPAIVNCLNWLRKHNPWLAAYKASLDNLDGNFAAMQQALATEGHVMPGGS